MFCKKCGTELRDDAKFCQKCGNVVENKNGVTEDIKVTPTMQPEKKNVNVQEKPGSLKSFSAVIVSIFLCIVMLLSITIIQVRKTVTEDNLADSIEITDEIFEEIVLEQIRTDLGKNIDIEESFEKLLRKDFDAERTVSKGDVENFVEDTNLSDFVSENISTYADDFFDGEYEFEIDEDDLEDYIRTDVANAFEDNFHVEMQEDDVEKWVKLYKRAEKNLAMNTIDDDQTLILDIVRWSLSYIILAVLIIISILLAYLLYASRNRKLACTFNWLGVDILICGIISTATILVGKYFAMNALDESVYDVEPISEMVGALLESSIITAIIAIVIGVLMIVGSIVAKKIIVKKKNI